MKALSARLRASFYGLLISLGAAQSVCAAPAPAPMAPSPPARLSDVAKPLAYDLQMTIVPSADKYSGRVAIDLDVIAPTQILWVHAEHLDVHRASVQIAGKAVSAKIVPGHDFVALRLPQLVPAGKTTLVLEYDGSFERQSEEGLIKVREQDDWYVATNFEPNWLRQVVPSIDELRAKAPWKITLEVPLGLAAFANTPEVTEEAISPTMKRVHFAPTLPIAAYVMAFAVGPFDVVDGGKAGRKGTPIRILVPKGTAAMARYAAESTGRILDLDEDLVNQAYPYEKLDVLALPGFDRFGAMENVGLITVESDLVLVAAGHDTPSFQQNYASTLAHEIAHMWFGNWLTPAGWNELWLNEGFADWVTPKTLARLNPAWQQNFQTDDARASALLADRLLSAHPLKLTSDSGEAAASAFDALTYSKAASVLRMVERWMGEDRFRDGVRHYIASHPNGNVSADDLYQALSAAADPHVAADVIPMMQGFVNQPGAPALDVGLICPENAKDEVKLDLNQLRFLPRAHVPPPLAANLVPPAEHWLMPVCFQFGEGGDYGETCTVVRDAHVVLPLPQGERCPNWVIANTDGHGYLLPLLRDPLLAHLADAPLLPDEAIPVLDDARVLLPSDAIGADLALGLAARFANHRQPLVVLASMRLAKSLPLGLIDGADSRDAYLRFLRKAYAARAELIGWQPKPGEREVDDLLRAELVPFMAGFAADAQLRTEADHLGHDALAGKAELGAMLGPVLSTMAVSGNQDLFDALAAAGARATSPTREAYYTALGRFSDPHLLDAALDLALSEKIDVRDGAFIFEAATSDPQLSAHVLDYVKTHFEAIGKRFGSASEYLGAAAQGVCDRSLRTDLEDFITAHSSKTQPLMPALADVLEKAQLCEAGRDPQIPRIRAFLAQQGQ